MCAGGGGPSKSHSRWMEKGQRLRIIGGWSLYLAIKTVDDAATHTTGMGSNSRTRMGVKMTEARCGRLAELWEPWSLQSFL